MQRVDSSKSGEISQSQPAGRVLLLLAVVMAALMIAIEAFVTSNVQFGADFHTFWVGARAMFLERVSPFSPQVTLRTQLGIYGRPPLPGEDPLGFAYPPYSLIAVLPSIWMPYPWAQAFWIAFNFTFLMGTVYYAFPDLPAWLLGILIFFYPTAYGIIIGNFGVPIGILLIIIYALLRRPARKAPMLQLASGIILAWLTIKPQMTWLLILFFLIYSLRYRLWGVMIGFFVGGLGFFFLTWALIPNWPLEWYQQIVLHADELLYFEPLALTYAAWIAPDRWSSAIALILVVSVVVLTGLLLLKWWQGAVSDLAPIAWTVLLTQLVHPLLLSPDQNVVLLPLFLWTWENRSRLPVVTALIWSAAIIAPWLMFFFPIFALNSFDITKVAVTKGPPLLFALWVIWVTRPELAIRWPLARGGVER